MDPEARPLLDRDPGWAYMPLHFYFPVLEGRQKTPVEPDRNQRHKKV
jgi:hypothetical protein